MAMKLIARFGVFEYPVQGLSHFTFCALVDITVQNTVSAR